VMTGTRTLRAHANPLEIVVAALRGDMVPVRLLSNPAGDSWTSPQATTWCRSLNRFGQFLLLVHRQEWWTDGWDPFQASIADAGRTVVVVAMDDPAGVGRVQADQLSGVFDRLAVGNQGEELPAACFNQVRGLTSSPAQLSNGEMGMKAECACHSAAYHSALISCGFRITLLC